MEQEGDRLLTELALLESMYPDQIRYGEKAREVLYHAKDAKFCLRLPPGYLVEELPEVVFAGAGRTDLREQLKQRIQQCQPCEEVLDSVILAFNDLLETVESRDDAPQCPNSSQVSDSNNKATIVVWLHHLLNTNKRKQALSPPSHDVSGVTKPGYPGVLVYSGPAKAVHEHVNELKQLNWAAFQVRLESDEEWIFSHGKGVRELEAMKEVVAEVGEARKEVFMEAMRMK